MNDRAAPAQSKTEAFIGKVLENTSSAFVTHLAILGDRLGLFKDLAANGPATSAELAARAAIGERYAREWLGGMANAGYLEYAPQTRRFALPPEHVSALAEENGEFFFGGVFQMLPALTANHDRLVDCFRAGGGVPQSAYGEGMWDGLERFTGGWYEHQLVQRWLPAMPEVEAKLRSGAEIADVGCGRGRSLIKLAQAFPGVRCTGYDNFAPTVERAAAAARAAGVAERVRFELCDAAAGIPGRYDLITTFEVIHDAADPPGLLRAIRSALRDDGFYVCVDVNCSERLEENSGPLGAMFHGFSVFYCMTTSLANGGAGLGTLGFHEPKVRELCAAAGFASVRRVPSGNPFTSLYEIRP